jgi:hypothetical protein
VLSDVEEEVLQIIKTVSLEGHNVLEPLVEFEDFNKSAELQSSLPSHETVEHLLSHQETEYWFHSLEEEDKNAIPSTSTMTTTNNKVCDKQHNNEKLTKKKLPKKTI